MTVRILALLLLPTVLLTGCQRNAAPVAAAPPLEVVVAQPEEKDVTDYEYFTGRTEAPESVDVRARVTGYIVKINFEPGGEVKKDQLLFKIDPRPYQAELDIAKGQLALDNAQLKLAIADYDIGKEVAKTPGAISQEKLNKLAAEQAKAEAAVQATAAKVEFDQINLDFTDVTSPITGIASRYYFSVGNLVNQDMTLLTTVVSEDPMWGYFQVDERTLLRIQKLMREGKIKLKAKNEAPVELGLANEEGQFPHHGTLDFVNNVVDKSTGTITIRGVFPNAAPANGGPRFLKPGLFIRVRVPVGPRHPALLVPEAAIGTDQGKKFLYVVNDQNVVEYRPITVGQQQAGGLRVVEPLPVVRTADAVRPVQPGEQGEPSVTKSDRVIVSGLQRVRSGVKVEVKEEKVGP